MFGALDFRCVERRRPAPALRRGLFLMNDLLIVHLSSITSLMTTDWFVSIMAGILVFVIGCFICSIIWGKS